jgi:hypothetical protein
MNDMIRHDTPKAPTGSLAELVAESAAPTFLQSFPLETCARIAILAGVLVWVNFWQLRIMVRTWMDDGNWSHGFLIPCSASTSSTAGGMSFSRPAGGSACGAWG